MKVKLFTPWDGPLPEWYPHFQQRLKYTRQFEHTLVQLPDHVKAMNALAQQVSGFPCHKTTAYAQCDYRPLFGEMFADQLRGCDWWGWCDLDIVWGDLDRLLGPFLATQDIISTCRHYVHGPMALVRNTPRLNTLYRSHPDLADVLAAPDYQNFDETGYNSLEQVLGKVWNENPNFTRMVQATDLKIHYDDRTWTESDDPVSYGTTRSDYVPARCCEIRGGRLREIPTRRELVLYHFTTKQWPIPNRFSSYSHLQHQYVPMQREPAVPQDTNWWQERINTVQRQRIPLHCITYYVPLGEWQRIQDHSRSLLQERYPYGGTLLDVGCGYGALLDVLPQEIHYVGVDCEAVLLTLAKQQYPQGTFLEHDARRLPFPDEHFDWCFCRGVESDVRVYQGNKAWRQIEQEMLRVARQGVLIVNMQCEHRVLLKDHA